MTNFLRIPPNSQAYMDVRYDQVNDKFDVQRFTYNYLNSVFPSPWAFYILGQTNTYADSVGNGGTLVASGATAPTWDSGEGALLFTAGASVDVAERYEEPAWFSLPVTKAFAVSFWFKVNGTDNRYFGEVALAPGSIDIILSNASTRSISGYNPFTGAMNTTGYTLNAWHHAVLVADFSQHVAMYLDNVKVDEDTVVGAFDDSSWTSADYSYGDLYIGNGRGDNTCYYKNVGIWLGNTLTDANVSQLWNNGSGWNPY